MEEDRNNPKLIITNISLKDATGKTITQPLVVATDSENYKKFYLKNKKEVNKNGRRNQNL